MRLDSVLTSSRTTRVHFRSSNSYRRPGGYPRVCEKFGADRFSPFVFIALLLCTAVATAQKASTVERSPEAIALIQRVLTASGGAVSNEAIRDLVATGTLSSPTDATENTGAPLTISMRGLDQLRVDSAFPKGTRSVFYDRGHRSSKEEDGAVVPLDNEDAFATTSHFFPLGHLAAALTDTSYSVTAPEAIADDESGSNVYHLRLQRTPPVTAGAGPPLAPSAALDYYIDAATSQIVRVRNPHSDRGATSLNRGPYEVYRFSGYRLDCGILLPHQITVSIDKRLISTINISAYQLNTGLADGHFAPVSRQ